MEGEDLRSGMKKRSKPVETGFDFDSENDEPIGSMLKLRRTKKKKKNKVSNLASEGSCGGDDAIRVKEGIGGMDDNDTLASFRKRLKGPKRDQGSEAAATLALNVSLEGHEDGGFVAGGSRSASMDERVVGLLLGDDMHLHHSSDQHMEDSLSAIFHKAQSNSFRKSRAALSSKQKRGNRNVDSVLSPGSKSFTETLDSRVESRSGSASKSVGGNLESAAVSSVSAMDNQKGGDTAKGICDSRIPDGPLVDQSHSINVCDGDRQQLSCVQVEDVVCGASDEKVAFQERILDCGLDQCSAMLRDAEKIDTASSPSKVGEGVCGFSEAGELDNILTDEIGQEPVGNGASEAGVSTSAGKEILLTSCRTEPLTKSAKNILNENENNYMVSGKVFQESSINGGAKLETEFVSGRHSFDYSSLDTNVDVKDFVVSCSPEKHDIIATGSSSSIVPNEANESELAVQSNHPEKPLEMCNIPKYSTTSILKCSSMLDPIQSGGSFIRSSIPDENGNTAEYHASVSDFADNDGKISSIPRVTRKTKMRKHGDMTYEGDADWEILINDKAVNESQVAVDGERILRTRVKHDSSVNAVEDSENVAAAAVSAGLKARAVGPIEKIKFKEILKRKGGLKEYLDCR